jgi:hypothetical protein
MSSLGWKRSMLLTQWMSQSEFLRLFDAIIQDSEQIASLVSNDPDITSAV